MVAPAPKRVRLAPPPQSAMPLRRQRRRRLLGRCRGGDRPVVRKTTRCSRAFVLEHRAQRSFAPNTHQFDMVRPPPDRRSLPHDAPTGRRGRALRHAPGRGDRQHQAARRQRGVVARRLRNDLVDPHVGVARRPTPGRRVRARRSPSRGRRSARPRRPPAAERGRASVAPGANRRRLNRGQRGTGDRCGRWRNGGATASFPPARDRRRSRPSRTAPPAAPARPGR